MASGLLESCPITPGQSQGKAQSLCPPEKRGQTVSRKQDTRSDRLNFDGACQPVNPGGMIAWGWILQTPEGQAFDSDCGVDPRLAPDNTNNVAEYLALIEGLRAAQEGQVSCLEVRGDSKLVIRQMCGEWGCHSERLRPLYEQAWDLARGFDRIGFEWVPRERNQEADGLAQMAYEEEPIGRTREA